MGFGSGPNECRRQKGKEIAVGGFGGRGKKGVILFKGREMLQASDSYKSLYEIASLAGGIGNGRRKGRFQYRLVQRKKTTVPGAG